MCGICGTAGFGDAEALRRMASTLVHRGPDDAGYFDDDAQAIYLANRRLSVIDVEGGHQPVKNETGDVVVVQNGEIYNFKELRRDLESKGHSFRSASDTEVLPHLYEEYGEAFCEHLDGMFAVAIWDARSRKLMLARDALGIKPLYIWQEGDRLAFASEVKALLSLGAFGAALDLEAMHFLLNVRFVPGERTLFSGVRKLPPGSLLVWEDGRTRCDRFWSLDAAPDPTIRRPEDCAAEVRRLLARSVDKQMVSDVPLGLYLSGGIDSSTLVALATENASTPLHTFALGFGEPTDELEDARLVANTFGTEHREDTLSMDALAVFPKVIWHVEEPKENAIQLYLLSRFARQHVTVALSGLGGDELFGGYRIFDWLRPTLPAHRLFGRGGNAALLWPVRKLVASLMGSLGSFRLDLARRAFDFAMSAGVPERSYGLLRNMWEHDRRLFEAIYTPAARARIEPGVERFFAPCFAGKMADPREGVLRAELAFKMVDDFLMNEDRTSMGNSLEVRVPFLDKDLVEYAFRIPARVKFAHGLKTVLKTAMRDDLPAATLAKPKWGFTFDSYHQFQKDLRTLALRELSRERIEAQGIFNYDFVRGVLDHPPHRWMRWHYFLLWLILGLKIWEDLFVHGKSPEDCYAPVA